jgi:hypothetical protein
MGIRLRGALCALLFFWGPLTFASADAARPIGDVHKLDAYYALFAPDSNVPWRPATVRLETYTSARVAFAVYRANPDDVLTAGSTSRPRAIDTRHLKPVARWSFTPPGGYQYQSSTIAVPLGSREGFFVVEASRGSVRVQVWINRTRVGLVAKQTPAGLLLYGADLRTGRALAKMRVQILAGNRLVTRYTDAHGIVRWGASPPAIFALAQWGHSYAFVPLLPQTPLPRAVIGVRADSAVVHAGDAVRVAGFVRVRARNGAYRAGSGSVKLSMRLDADEIARSTVTLDAAGAFDATMALPSSAAAGDYAILAQADDEVGSATVHVDADPGGLLLSVAPHCARTCDPNADVPLDIRALRNGKPAAGVNVAVNVVRSPHLFDAASGDAAWGVSQWLDTTVQTGSDGRASTAIAHPTDGLSSTYGVSVSAGGATADTRFAVATSRAGVSLTLDHTQIAPNAPLNFTVTGVDLQNGSPLAGRTVTVQLLQGAAPPQTVTLTYDAAGRATGSFATVPLGASTIVAQTTYDGASGSDAAEVQAGQQPTDDADDASSAVRVTSDRARYRVGEAIAITGSDAGAQGDALITLDGAEGTQATVTPQRNGVASASFRARDDAGQALIGAAFVHRGTLEWNASPIFMDAPGHAVDAQIALDKPSYAPGERATARVDGEGGATYVVRVSRGEPSGDALFSTLADVLAVDVSSTQTSAPPAATWHPWVDASGSHAQVYGFESRGSAPPSASLAQADSQPVSWAVVRSASGSVAVPVPAQSGSYTLSILKIFDDGRIAAASSNLIVR